MYWRELPFAPDVGVKLAHKDELSEHGLHEIILGEGDDIFRMILMREIDQIYVYLNRCPHFGVALNSSNDSLILMKDRQVMCATHCAVFKMRDGLCVDGPVKGQHLTLIETVIDNEGNILIR